MRSAHGAVCYIVIDREKNEFLRMQFEILKFFHKFFSYDRKKVKAVESQAECTCASKL